MRRNSPCSASTCWRTRIGSSPEKRAAADAGFAGLVLVARRPDFDNETLALCRQVDSQFDRRGRHDASHPGAEGFADERDRRRVGGAWHAIERAGTGPRGMLSGPRNGLRNSAKGDGGPVVQGPGDLLAAHLQRRSFAKSTALSELDGVALHRALDKAVDSACPAEGPRHVVSSLLQDHHHFRGASRSPTHPRSVDGIGSGAAKLDDAPAKVPGYLLAARPQ